MNVMSRMGMLVALDHRCLCAGWRYGCRGWKAYFTKAETAQDARECLAILSGRRHRVYGGIALHSLSGKSHHRLVQSVRFRRLSALDIELYIDHGDWQGKAGGYAIQGVAARFISNIGGSYSNIVGFSIYDVAAMLMPPAVIRRATIWIGLKKFNLYRGLKEDHDQCGEAVS